MARPEHAGRQQRLDLPMAAAAAFLAVALIAGGASRDAPLAAAAVGLTGIGVFCVLVVGRDWPPSRLTRSLAFWLLGVIVLLPALYLIPLPPELWGRAPGHALFAAGYTAAGMPAPWLPLSVSPHRTMQAALAMAPFAAAFLAAFALDRRGRQLCIEVVLVVALGSILLGILQVTAGPDSPLRFYEFTNPTAAVGFFANRNHQASLLLAALPLGAAAFAVRSGDKRSTPLSMILGAALLVILIVGLGVARSRAGLLLLIPALLATLAVLLPQRRAFTRSPIAGALILTMALGVLIVVLFGIQGTLGRLQSGGGQDLRFQLIPSVLELIRTFLPFGGGPGTFDPAYRIVEPVDLMQSSFINHAHNDLLELLYETGLVGGLLLALFLSWWVMATFQTWRSRDMDSSTRTFALACSGVIGLLLLHSLADYPLRTPALAVLFAFAWGVLARATSSEEPANDSLSRRLRRENGPASRP